MRNRRVEIKKDVKSSKLKRLLVDCMILPITIEDRAIEPCFFEQVDKWLQTKEAKSMRPTYEETIELLKKKIQIEDMKPFLQKRGFPMKNRNELINISMDVMKNDAAGVNKSQPVIFQIFLVQLFYLQKKENQLRIQLVSLSIIASFLVNVPLISSFVDDKSEPVIFLKNCFSESLDFLLWLMDFKIHPIFVIAHQYYM